MGRQNPAAAMWGRPIIIAIMLCDKIYYGKFGIGSSPASRGFHPTAPEDV